MRYSCKEYKVMTGKCLILKYKGYYGYDDEEIERCIILNENYSKKFNLTPINEISISYNTSGGYDCEYTNAKLYFMEKISRKTYDEIKRLNLAKEGDEIIALLK
jgi:hypothetical protein